MTIFIGMTTYLEYYETCQQLNVVKYDYLQMIVTFHVWSQLAITCSKLKLETLEQGVKYVQSYDRYMIVLVSLLLTLDIFHTLF